MFPHIPILVGWHEMFSLSDTSRWLAIMDMAPCLLLVLLIQSKSSHLPRQRLRKDRPDVYCCLLILCITSSLLFF